MTTLLIGVGQGSLPVVSYVKAVDWYLIFCYIFVFSAFAEYAILNNIQTGHKSTELRMVRMNVLFRKNKHVIISELLLESTTS